MLLNTAFLKARQAGNRLLFYSIFAVDEVNGGKATQGALAGILVGTALSLGVSAVKATFVAGVVAAFVSLVPFLGNVDDTLSDEGMLTAFIQHLDVFSNLAMIVGK